MLVQSTSATSGAALVASLTATFATPPVAGNLLIAILGSDSTAGMTSKGWLLAASAVNFQAGYLWYKIAGVNEPSAVLATLASSDTAVLAIFEYSSASGWVAQPLDRVTQNTTVSNVSSLATGVTPATVYPTELAIAFSNPHGGWTAAGPSAPTWTNGYANILTVAGTTNATATLNVALFIASKNLTSPASQSTTNGWSTTSSNDGIAIATFMVAPGTLPFTPTNLIDIDTNKNVMNVAIDDGDYFIQYGSKYMIQEYKMDWTNNTDVPTFTWKGRTTRSTLISPFLIQIYNVTSGQWETLARETRQPADVDFTLRVTQTTNPSNYYDASNIVTFRSYQQVI